MIAFPKSGGSARGRRRVDTVQRGEPRAYTGRGSATSAALLQRRPGTRERSEYFLFVPSEGWVRCSEIYRQVAVAYERWRVRKALQGVRIDDAEERRQREIMGGGGDRAVRARWLKAWQRQHAELCQWAGVSAESEE